MAEPLKKKLSDQIRKDGLPAMTRTYELRAEDIDAEKRTITFPFSSEYAVERWGWVETLGHEKSEIDLGRMNNAGPYLMDHDIKDQRGVVETAWVDKKRGFCTVRLSKNERGEELLQDHIDGIRTHASVRYAIHELVLEKNVDGVPHYRAVRWEPLEISSVSVPADPTVGIGRSGEESQHNPVTIREANKMDEDENIESTPATETPTGARSNSPESKKPATAARAAATPAPASNEPSEAQRIAETAEQYGAVDLGNEHIRNGKTYEEFRNALTEKLHKKRSDPAAESTMIDLDLPTQDLRRYSLINALRGAVTGNWKNAGLERNVSNAIAERVGKDPNGVYISYEAMGFGLREQMKRNMMLRQQEVATPTKGPELVATELHSEMFIDILRARATIGGLGARFMSGLVGNVDIPKQVGSASFFWVAEDTAPAESDLTLAVVQMAPRTISTAVPITRRLMIQSTPDVESLVRDDIMWGLSLGIDNALLKGSGVGEEPLGIINAPGVGAVDVSAGAGGVDWGKIVELETDVGEANASAATSAYVMRPTMRGTLKTTEKATNTGKFIWDEQNMVNGYQAAVTTEMLAGDILFGDFSQAMVGMWGALDVVPDRSTKVATGGLVMRIFQDADVALRHETAFSYADDGS